MESLTYFSITEMAYIYAALKKLKEYEKIGTVGECRREVRKQKIGKIIVKRWRSNTQADTQKP